MQDKCGEIANIIWNMKTDIMQISFHLSKIRKHDGMNKAGAQN